MSANDLSRYDQKLEFILRSAAQIFADKSYHSTSMRDISRATNVSLAGLYHYCKSKKSLCFPFRTTALGGVLGGLKDGLNTLKVRSGRWGCFLRTIFPFFRPNWARWRFFCMKPNC